MRERSITVVLGLIIATAVLVATSVLFDNIKVTYRTPIILKFQTPVVIEKRHQATEEARILNPVPEETATPSATPTVKQAKVVQPFKKFLTIEGNETRNKVLPLIASAWKDEVNQVSFDNILKIESGYRADAVNSIGACGMGQANPCVKMDCELSYTDEAIKCQLDWINNYIVRRYGTPEKAWNFHMVNGWY